LAPTAELQPLDLDVAVADDRFCRALAHPNQKPAT
jgi:hypothetical protein